uniref:Uncharacterized protein n=1 Tax=Myoviridae sp. ctJ2i1 TaxID=2825079 RepID=A0A8S5V1X5_9CAUD|nr:MAG TPA: hypothetical protein [Myoviridae sp. ctJ2i1]
MQEHFLNQRHLRQSFERIKNLIRCHLISFYRVIFNKLKFKAVKE